MLKGNPVIIPQIINSSHTPLHEPAPTQSTTACEACELRPLQEWGWGACALCEDEQERANSSDRRYFRGRRLGDIRQTETLPKVVPPNYPQWQDPSGSWCTQFKVGDYGASWQYTSSMCKSA